MKKSSRKFSVLIPDTDAHKHLALQVINCLSLYGNTEVYIMSSSKYNFLRYSRNIKRFSFYPEPDEKTWIKNIDLEVKKHNIDIILPVFEYGIRKIIKNKDLLSTKERLCILPSLKNFDIAGNKGLLYEHLKLNSFPCPDSVITESDKFPNLENLEFPIIAKPVIGFGGGQEIKILNNKKEVENYHSSIQFSCNTIYQKFISGYDVCCNVLCNNGELLAYSIQSTSIIKKVGVTPQMGFNFIKHKELLSVVEKVMKSLNWSGVANIDCRFDESDSSFKVIEINTRYWINVDASAIAKVNFPYLHCLATFNEKFDLSETSNISYLNLKGLVRHLSKQPSMLFNFRYVKNNTPLLFALKDPMPMTYKFIWRTKNLMVKRLKKQKVK